MSSRTIPSRALPRVALPLALVALSLSATVSAQRPVPRATVESDRLSATETAPAPGLEANWLDKLDPAIPAPVAAYIVANDHPMGSQIRLHELKPFMRGAMLPSMAKVGSRLVVAQGDGGLVVLEAGR